jgi:CRP-like cAMP-binding protein
MRVVASAISDRELIFSGNEAQYLIDESFGLVVEGSFRIVDDEIVESEFSGGACYGDATLIRSAKSPSTLIANETSRVVLVDRKKLNRPTRRMPRTGNALLRSLSRHLSERIVVTKALRPINPDNTGSLA